jgi:hypothetical protein
MVLLLPLKLQKNNLLSSSLFLIITQWLGTWLVVENYMYKVKIARKDTLLENSKINDLGEKYVWN